MQIYKVNAEGAKAVYEYLIEKPYKEVVHLVGALNAGKIEDEPDPVPSADAPAAPVEGEEATAPESTKAGAEGAGA